MDADQHKDLASQYKVQGFPTIKVLYLEGDSIKSSDYNGARSAKVGGWVGRSALAFQASHAATVSNHLASQQTLAQT